MINSPASLARFGVEDSESKVQMSREKGTAREREKYESELDWGTALRVSEGNIILEIAEVLWARGAKQK